MERVFKKKFLKLKESSTKKIKRITINESHLMELNVAVNDTSSDVSSDIKDTFRNVQRELGNDKAKKAGYVISGDDVNEDIEPDNDDNLLDVIEQIVRRFFNEYNDYEDYDTFHDIDGHWLGDAVMERLFDYYEDLTGKPLEGEAYELAKKEFIRKMDLYEAKVLTKKQIMEAKKKTKKKSNVECYCSLTGEFLDGFLKFLKKNTSKNMDIDIDPDYQEYNLKFKGNLQINDYYVDLLDKFKYSTKIYFDAQSPEDLKKLFRHLEQIGNGGHSFSVNVNGKYAFSFDGDGSDYIKNPK